MADDAIKIHKVNATDPQITMTDKALTHTKRWLEKSGGLGLRLSTKETGCSGLEYVIDIVHEIHESDLKSEIDNDVTVFVDKEAFSFLKGSKLDYIKEGINFKFVFENPNATGVCGCGESFTVE